MPHPLPPQPPTHQFNLPLFRKLGDLGLLGLTVDPQYGGSGMDAAAVAVAHEELSAADPAFCLAYLAHALLFVNNLAQVRFWSVCSIVHHSARPYGPPSPPLNRRPHHQPIKLPHARKPQNGSHEQKLRYLPEACSGATVGGMCMSEPGAGTDVLGMSTTAAKAGDGSYYTLTGAKMWITNGTLDGKGTGDVYLVYAKTGASGRVGGCCPHV